MQSGERPGMGEGHKGFWESRNGLAKADRNGGGAMDQPRAWPKVKYTREHWEPGRSGLNPKIYRGVEFEPGEYYEVYGFIDRKGEECGCCEREGRRKTCDWCVDAFLKKVAEEGDAQFTLFRALRVWVCWVRLARPLRRLVEHRRLVDHRR